MNLLGTISRILVVLAVVFVSNTRAVELRNCAKPTLIGGGSVLINEKKAAELFGEEYISARKQVIIGKAVLGGVTTLIPDAYRARCSNNSSGYFQQTPSRKNSFVEYVVVNGVLRLGGDSFSLNENFIDKKCDEYLPENVAWIAKPVTTFVVDLAYDYVTIRLVKGFMDGVNKSK